MTVEQFWAMTPRETMMVIEAAGWRMDQEQRGRAWLAWHVAVLSRAKKIPSLNQLLAAPKGQALKGKALMERRKEFAEMKERVNKWHKAHR